MKGQQTPSVVAQSPPCPDSRAALHHRHVGLLRVLRTRNRRAVPIRRGPTSLTRAQRARPGTCNELTRGSRLTRSCERKRTVSRFPLSVQVLFFAIGVTVNKYHCVRINKIIQWGKVFSALRSIKGWLYFHRKPSSRTLGEHTECTMYVDTVRGGTLNVRVCRNGCLWL